jgi:opacity protein-like surface antigen
MTNWRAIPAIVAASLVIGAAIAGAQTNPPPSVTAPRSSPRDTTIGIQGIAIVGVNWPAASKSLEASGLKTNPIEFGGGVQVTNIWRNLFAQVSASRMSDTGERAFVDDQGNAFPLGIPLTVKTTYLDVSGGWKFASADQLNVLTYFGGGVGRANYAESSPFAQPGDDLDTKTTSYHVLVGAEVRLASWLSVSGDLRYRWVPDLLGTSGVSAAYGEKDFGGFHAGAGLRVGFGGPPMRKPPPPDDVTATPGEPREPARVPTRVASSDSATIVGSAPVYLRPDAKLEPLRVLEAGTSVRVLQENDDWIRIQFADRLLGPRVGYVQRKHVQLPK